MKYRVLVGVLVLAGMASFVSCGGSSSTSIAPNPGTTGTGFIFVATQGDQKMVPFTLDEAAGKVSTNGNGLPTGTQPSAAVMTPDGNTIFLANQVSGDISRYTVKPDGTLTAVSPNISVGGANSNPIAMTMDAAGKFLFVLDQGAFGAVSGSSILVFSIGSNAGLNAVGTLTGLNSASAVAVTPDGKYLYVTDSFYSTILGYAFDGNGNLTLLPDFPPPGLLPSGPPGGKPIPNAITPMGLTVTLDDPNNPSSNQIFLYVANANASSGNISVFEICDKPTLNCVTSTGDLTEITGSPFSTGGEPGSMVIVNPTVITPPSGTFLYVTDHKLNHLLQFRIALVTGALTSLSPASISTGTSPVWVSARHDGQYIFTANNGSNSFSAFFMQDPTTGVLVGAVTPVNAAGNFPSVVLAK